ncbi:MAG: phosphoribosylaminoimidazole-succinocarboxamide synthase [[Candidatus Thermochlorobacteriaceae] bacterium GBChlB]|nr:MAG: phosphoribosylaminoimidazole-succinocarboxamide synthase [[Candidatus Thermochlorobacteriaceae] bacterium GBChlB]
MTTTVIKGDLLYEGKAKKVYATDNPDLIIQEFKDDATAFNAQKKGQIVGKGIINNDLSSHLFTYLESFGIATHFVSKLSEREMLCKRLDILKIEVVTRNIAAGSLVKRYGFTEGEALRYPIIELYLKNDALGDPLINDDHAVLLGLGTPDDIARLKQLASKINGVMQDYFLQKGLKLVDFKLEFGRHHGAILLGDEISPDTCRLWDKDTDTKLDKDRFRFDLGNVEDAYREVRKRLIG